MGFILTTNRYNVHANDIRRVNGLIGNADHSIYRHVVLRIPANPQQIQDQGTVAISIVVANSDFGIRWDGWGLIQTT